MTKNLIKPPWIYLICLLGTGGAIVLCRSNLKNQNFDGTPVSPKIDSPNYFDIAQLKQDAESEQPIMDCPYFFSLPIHSFSRANIPILEMGIENQRILARLDLGLEGGLCLPESILSKSEKKQFKKNTAFLGCGEKPIHQTSMKYPK